MFTKVHYMIMNFVKIGTVKVFSFNCELKLWEINCINHRFIKNLWSKVYEHWIKCRFFATVVLNSITESTKCEFQYSFCTQLNNVLDFYLRPKFFIVANVLTVLRYEKCHSTGRNVTYILTYNVLIKITREERDEGERDKRGRLTKGKSQVINSTSNAGSK